MKARCNYIKSISYPNYGGKGIKVCKEWAESYVAFRDWSISHEYADDLTIDRIDSNGNYEPSNCRWTTQYEQNRNRSVNIYATINGETRIIADWCKEFGLNISTVYSRIYHGWGELKALTTPINER
jgi:hypothetical protein